MAESIDQVSDYTRKLAELDKKQDRNMEEHRIIEKTKCELEDFYAWSTRWQAECEAIAPADSHSRMLLESLSASVGEARGKSDQAVEDMIEDNRLDALKLSSHKEMLLEERRRSYRESGEGGDR